MCVLARDVSRTHPLREEEGVNFRCGPNDRMRDLRAGTLFENGIVSCNESSNLMGDINVNI